MGYYTAEGWKITGHYNSYKEAKENVHKDGFIVKECYEENQYGAPSIDHKIDDEHNYVPAPKEIEYYPFLNESEVCDDDD